MSQVLDNLSDVIADFSAKTYSAMHTGESWTNDVSGPVNNADTGGTSSYYLETMWIPASQMMTTSTNGATSETIEYATNDVNRTHFAFDGTTDEHVNFSVVMPYGWDLGDVKVRLYWAGATGCSAADQVVWGVRACAKSDANAIDAAYSAIVSLEDEITASGEQQITEWSEDLTIAGNPSIGDIIDFDIYRIN